MKYRATPQDDKLHETVKRFICIAGKKLGYAEAEEEDVSTQDLEDGYRSDVVLRYPKDKANRKGRVYWEVQRNMDGYEKKMEEQYLGAEYVIVPLDGFKFDGDTYDEVLNFLYRQVYDLVDVGTNKPKKVVKRTAKKREKSDRGNFYVDKPGGGRCLKKNLWRYNR